MIDLTVLVITFNEEANIERTLEAVKWAPHLLIVDSGSVDRTLEIARRYPQVEIAARPFDTFAGQCNFGLRRARTEWVLSIDADYVVSPELASEIQQLAPKGHIAGLTASFIYSINGRPLRSTLYPPRTVLYQRARASYRQEGHGHRVLIDGALGRLAGPIYHDDRKPLKRWFDSQLRYARQEADHLFAAPSDSLRRIDRLRRLGWPAPAAVFFYTLLYKRCALDGWSGWHYVLQRTVFEFILALEVADRRLRRSAAVE